MIPDTAVELAKTFEGFHKKVRHGELVVAVPYLCPANFWTIGYGHRCSKDTPEITEEEAEKLLVVDLLSAYNAVNRLCPTRLTSNQLAALIDFTFNLGAGRLQTSTLRKRVLENNWVEAQYEIRRWVYGGGVVLPGLVVRRSVEAKLLIT